jgi:hypothetical protein
MSAQIPGSRSSASPTSASQGTRIFAEFLPSVILTEKKEEL